MDIPQMRQRVAEAPVARLATVDQKGQPHLVPVCFALDSDTLYSSIDQKPKTSLRLRRLDNIRERPDVSVLVDHYEDDWARLWWVRMDGKARLVETGPERDRAVMLLEGKYAQYRVAAPTGPVIVVSIEKWRGWSASETMAP